MEEIDLSGKNEEDIGVPVVISGVETAKTLTDSPPDLIEALLRVEAFADLPTEQLEWFIAHAEERHLKAGEVLFHKGNPAEWMLVYLSGEVHVQRDENNLDGYVYIARAGDPATEVSGKLPFSRMKEISATARAVVPTRVLMFPVRLFPEMLQRMPDLAERLVWIMSDRVRETTRQDQQRDKLIALGKLSAGLAHELNNPAAAARSTTDELLDVLKDLRDIDLRLCRHGLTPAQLDFVTAFELDAIAQAGNAATQRNALAQSDLEDELSSWLDTLQVEDGWQISGTLVEAGLSVTKLAHAEEEIGVAAFRDVLSHLAAHLSAAKLTGEIKNSVTRISELVGAIKEYSYMDQGAVQKVDIVQGLENTLLILKYKLKKKNISVVREFDADLPLIIARGSELNQVWTNIIDNAVYAMPDGGQLIVRVKLEPANILVEIQDNGSGIPPALKARIFEPFFTTKGVGEGTGLGLDTVTRVVRLHRGNLRVESKPGDTRFQIRLPFVSLTPTP